MNQLERGIAMAAKAWGVAPESIHFIVIPIPPNIVAPRRANAIMAFVNRDGDTALANSGSYVIGPRFGGMPIEAAREYAVCHLFAKKVLIDIGGTVNEC